jgi:hypothetical protein
MGIRAAIIIFLLSFSTGFLCAQKVLYSPFITNQAGNRFDVIGKAGGYYWVQKSKKKIRTERPADLWKSDKDFNLEIYDARMNPVKTIFCSNSNGLVKEYFVSGDQGLDQLILQSANQKIILLLNRYSPDGNSIRNEDSLADFPGYMQRADFLLIRSQNKNKILLLGFEPVPESPPRLHALLFDKNWKLIRRDIYSNKNISQPFVQDEFVDYPLDDYNSGPVKLSDSGEWLMIVPSRINRNYLLFHFKETDEGFVYKEIKMPPSATIEEVGLYLNNKKEEVFAGILSRIRAPAIKNVRIARYSLSDCRVDFDTSYFFNTLAGNKIKNENIYEEYFMTVPGRGFMLLKEYGRIYSSDFSEEKLNKENEQPDEISSLADNAVPGPINKNEYTRYNNLAGTRKSFERGDLSLYYFPATSNDSCWSAIINKEQITELNSSYLSYVLLPKEDKLFFLYNCFYRNSEQYSSATVLDPKGNLLNEGVEYWKINNTLIFQKARQISENELAVPYERNWREGFAIIRL